MATAAKARVQKPVSTATRELLDEMEADAAAPKSEDKLERVRDRVRRLRDLEFENDDLAAKVKKNNEQINELKNKTLVDMLDEVGLGGMKVNAEGNMPPYEIQLGDYYKANIPEDNQAGAYRWLTEQGHDDLIKTTFSIEFGLGEADDVKVFEKLLVKNEVAYSKKQGVPWNTLTAFVKEQYEVKKKPLTKKVQALLGATVGRVVKVVKEKKPRASSKKGK